jgi:hypothetical protein
MKVSPDQHGLAMEEWYLSSIFEIYVNGARLVQNGKFAPYVPYTYNARLVEPIPESAIASGSVVQATVNIKKCSRQKSRQANAGMRTSKSFPLNPNIPEEKWERNLAGSVPNGWRKTQVSEARPGAPGFAIYSLAAARMKVRPAGVP